MKINTTEEFRKGIKYGDMYYSISSFGVPFVLFWQGNKSDRWRMNTDNVFETRGNALAHIRMVMRGDEFYKQKVKSNNEAVIKAFDVFVEASGGRENIRRKLDNN